MIQLNLHLKTCKISISSCIALALGIGTGYDIIEKFYVEARYAFELTNRSTGDIDNLSIKFDPLTLGVGYKFN